MGLERLRAELAETGLKIHEYRNNITGVTDGWEEATATTDRALATLQEMSNEWERQAAATQYQQDAKNGMQTRPSPSKACLGNGI